MMTHLWVYEGELDADERVLTLKAQGPSMASEGKMTQYKDVTEFKSDDHRVLTSHILSDDGNWPDHLPAQRLSNRTPYEPYSQWSTFSLIMW
jgi:hypothetical protein